MVDRQPAKGKKSARKSTKSQNGKPKGKPHSKAGAAAQSKPGTGPQKEADLLAQVFPNEQVVHKFARDVGLDPQLDSAHLWICQQAVDEPLPDGWQILKDPEGVFFYQKYSPSADRTPRTASSFVRTYSHPRTAAYAENMRKLKLKTYERQGRAMEVCAADGSELTAQQRKKRQQKELAASLEAATLFYRSEFGDPDVDCIEDVQSSEIPRYWEVTPDDVRRQISLLGIRPEREPQMLWIARLAAAAPLPSTWARGSSEHGVGKYVCSEWVHQAPGFGVSVEPGTDYFRDVVRAYREEYGGVDGGYSGATGSEGGASQQTPPSTMKFQDLSTGRFYLFDFVTNKPTEGAPAAAGAAAAAAGGGGLQAGAAASDTSGADVSSDDDPQVLHSGLDPTGEGDSAVEGQPVSCGSGGGQDETACLTLEGSQHGFDDQTWELAQAIHQAFLEASAGRDHFNDDGLTRHVGALGVSNVASVVQALCRELESAEASARLAVKKKNASAKAKIVERLQQRLEFLSPVLQAELPETWSIAVTPTDSGSALSSLSSSSDGAQERVFFIRGCPWPETVSARTTGPAAEDALSSEIQGSSNDDDDGDGEAALLAGGGKEARNNHISAHLRRSADAKHGGVSATGGASPSAEEEAAAAAAAAAAVVDPWWPNFATTQFPRTKALCRKWVKLLQKSLAERVANRSSNRASEQARLAERQEQRRQAERDAATAAATAAATTDAMRRFRVAASSVADMAAAASLMTNFTTPLTAPATLQSPTAAAAAAAAATAIDAFHTTGALSIQTNNLPPSDALHPLVSPLPRSRSGSVQNVLAAARAESESGSKAPLLERFRASEEGAVAEGEGATSKELTLWEEEEEEEPVGAVDITEANFFEVTGTPPGTVRGPQRRDPAPEKHSESRKWKATAQSSRGRASYPGEDSSRARAKQKQQKKKEKEEEKKLGGSGQNVEVAPPTGIFSSPLVIHSSKGANHTDHSTHSGRQSKSLWLKPTIQQHSAAAAAAVGGGPGSKDLAGTRSSDGASLRRLSQAGVLGKDKEVLSLTLEQYLRQQQEKQQQQQQQQQRGQSSKPVPHPFQKHSVLGGNIAHGLGPPPQPRFGHPPHATSNNVYAHGFSKPQRGEYRPRYHFNNGLPNKSPLYSLTKAADVRTKSLTVQKQSTHILHGGRGGVKGGASSSSSSMFAL